MSPPRVESAYPGLSSMKTTGSKTFALAGRSHSRQSPLPQSSGTFFKQ
jgi:hypothetical protein